MAMRWYFWLIATLWGTVCAISILPVSSTSPLEPPAVGIHEQPGTIGPTFEALINPLTGQVLADETARSRPPIIVKVSNSPALVRPQWGISLADIVYEHYTEVGITRFSAIFLTHAPDRVGSIRSARLIDYELAPMYGALLAFSGASIGVDKRFYGTQHVVSVYCPTAPEPAACANDVLEVGPVGDLPPSDFAARAYKAAYHGEPLYYRDEELPLPHNMFANLQQIWARAAREGHNQRAELTGMRFNDALPLAPSQSGIYAEVRYLTTVAEWYYDSASNRYYRSSDGEPHYDALTQTQIAADNVLIVYAGHFLTDIVESGGGDNVHWSAQITLWPRGEGVLLRDGRSYAVEWRRETRSDLLSVWTTEGQPIPFKPGQTWIQVVRTADQMDVTNERITIQ